MSGETSALSCQPLASTAALLVVPVSGAADQPGGLEKPVADSALLVNADREFSSRFWRLA